MATWLATAEIPPEHVTHGALTEIAAKVDTDLRALIESDADALPEARKIRDLYASIMDAAVRITRSDFASMQILVPDRGASGELQLLTS